MIRRQGEYYICEDENPQQPSPPQPAQQDRLLSTTGDIRERLTLIKQRVTELRDQRRAAPPAARLQLPLNEEGKELGEYSVSLSVPSELLELEGRVERLEEKIGAQVGRQGVERGGTIVERVRRLQKKLQEMIKNKSVEIINQNVNQYSSNLDEKEEHFKHLSLYDVLTRTQGLAPELQLLEKYLNSLAKVQRAINSLPPLPSLITVHNNLIAKQQQLSQRTSALFQNMKQQYLKLVGEIDAIEI